METEGTDPANTIGEIRSTPVGEITREQVFRWLGELDNRKSNVKSGEEFECLKHLADALHDKLFEFIDSLPSGEQDEVRKTLPREKWRFDVAARYAGDLKAVTMGEKVFQCGFVLNTITRQDDYLRDGNG